MKHIIIILLLTCGFCNNAFTQDETIVLKKEWSANVNFFLNELILSKNQTESIIDYNPGVESLATFRRFVNSKNAWQIGGKFYTKKNDEDFAQGFGGNQHQEKKGYYLRVGYQNYRHLSEHVKFYLGSDLLLSFQKYTGTINFDDIPSFIVGNFEGINREKEIGIIPHLGIRYQLNSRFSFSAESNLIISYIYKDQETESSFTFDPFFSGFNDSRFGDSEQFNFNFQQPIVLFFNFRF